MKIKIKKKKNTQSSLEKEIYAERNAIYASTDNKPLRAYYWEQKRKKYKKQNEEGDFNNEKNNKK